MWRAEHGTREEVLYWTPRSARRALTWYAGDDYPQVCARPSAIASASAPASCLKNARPLTSRPLSGASNLGSSLEVRLVDAGAQTKRPRSCAPRATLASNVHTSLVAASIPSIPLTESRWRWRSTSEFNAPVTVPGDRRRRIGELDTSRVRVHLLFTSAGTRTCAKDLAKVFVQVVHVYC